MAPVTEQLMEARATDAARGFVELLAAAKRRPRAAIHGFHRWYGKLVPAIPAAAIEAFSEPGELVVDPFCGSGTVLVEARLAGRAAEGRDVNPLARLLSRVKTRALEPEALELAAQRVSRRFARPAPSDWRRHVPDLPNREHYYPGSVARDLVRLLLAARAEPDAALREWFEALASAINRDVSNADTRHVFPGVSKNMRARIAEGWIGDVPKRFGRALRKRLAASRELFESSSDAPDPVVGDAPASELVDGPSAPAGRADLVVTNPPYLSSIRWVETFKLEAWWLGLVSSREDLLAIDRSILGTERLDRSRVPLEGEELSRCASETVRPLVEELASRGEHRMARVVLRFFDGLALSLEAVARALRPGARAVVKLAPSRVRGSVIPTPDATVELLERAGLELDAALHDEYDQGSRTLTRARNWYSGRMDADVLLVFRKPEGRGSATAVGSAP